MSRRAELTTLLAILVVATVLRIVGISGTYPYLHYIDDGHFMKRVINMIATNDLNPHWYNWPSLMIYVHAAIAKIFVMVTGASGCAEGMVPYGINASRLYNVVCPAALILVARGVTLAFGVATVWLIYHVGRYAAGTVAGLGAAAALAIVPEHVEFSRNITGDVPMTFFAVAALFFSMRIHDSASRRDFVFCGISVGLAVACKYTAGVLLVLPIVAVLLRRPRDKCEILAALLVPIVAGITFFGVCPYYLVDFREAYDTFWYEVTYYHQDQNYRREFSRLAWLLNFSQPTRFGAPLFIVGVAGGLWTLMIRNWKLSLPWFFMVPYVIPLALAPAQPFRNFLPVAAFICLWAGYALAYLVTWRSYIRPRVITLLFACAIAVLAPSFSGAWSVSRTRATASDSRFEVIAWLAENVSPGAPLVIDAALQLYPDTLAELSRQGWDLRVELAAVPQLSTADLYVAGSYESYDLRQSEIDAHNALLADMDLIVSLGEGDIHIEPVFWVKRNPYIGVYHIK